MKTKNTWDIERTVRLPQLKENIQKDVVIIGAGLAGLWSAYQLSKKGLSVAVIDCNKVGQGTTLYTTAFITQDIDTDLSELVDIYGKRTTKLAWQAGKEAIDLIEKVIVEEKIDCEFKRSPLYIYADDTEGFDALKVESDLAQNLGFDTEMHERAAFRFKNAGAMEIKNQAKFHPMKFYYGLLDVCLKQGVEIFEKTEATKISGNARIVVGTKNGFSIKATRVVVATYNPFNNPKATHFKKAMYTSYVYELKVKKGSVPEGMYLDTHNPYHYIRVDSLDTHDRMIIGGEDHRAELKIPKKSFKALEEFIQKTFPGLQYEIITKWDGAILEPSDGMPLIGEYLPHQYVATAFSGNGMTYAAISSVIIRDLIMNKQNKYINLYDPKRKLTAKALYEKAKDYGQEFVGGALKNIFK